VIVTDRCTTSSTVFSHGTGTSVGDPIEAEAISIAMNYNRRPGVDDPLIIGAVKTNIGHGEAASGLSALIKAVLIVERGMIPPTIGISKLSSKIKWDEWQIQVPTEPTPFPSHLPVRRVSVNTCGYGGTNAHVIVEEAASFLNKTPNYKYIDSNGGRRRALLSRQSGRGRGPAALRKRPFLLPFSANDKATLRRNIEAHGRVADEYSLLDLSHTLCNRRTTHACKGFTVASHKTLRDAFSDVEGSSSSFSFMDKKKEPPTAIGFVFTGQGAQWARMGAELMEYSPRFLSTIRALDRAFDALPDGPEWSIEDVLLESESTSPVNQAEFSQPLCTAVQIALVDTLADWGIRPTVTVGHSSGEMAAAYAAGLISAEEAITAAYYRGVVTRDVKEGGAMMAVGLSAEAAEEHIANVKQGKVIVACHNSPAGVTLSGDAGALEELKVKFDVDNIFARFVKTNGKAYHSHYMAPVADKYQAMLEEARATSSFPPPQQQQGAGAKMVSSVTNSVLTDSAQLDGKYWTANLASPVLFNQAVQTILTSDEFRDVELLIEVGPHSAMAGPIQQIKTALQAERLEYLPSLLRGTDSAVQLLKLAGEMFLRSYPLDMETVTSAYVPEWGEKGSVIVDLPRYQWNYGRHFWPENRASREHRRATHARHDLLGQKVLGASLAEPTWRNVLRIRDVPWLRDHSLGGEAVFPAAGYFSMAMEAITQLHEKTIAAGGGDVADKIESYTLRDVSIKKALVTPDDDDGIEVLTNLRPSLYGAGWWDFSVSSVDSDGTEKEHMAGSVGINKASPRGFRKPREMPEFTQRASGRAWNEALRDVGFDYGPTFQDMDDIRFDGRQYAVGCTTAVTQAVDEGAMLGESRHVLHPASVDSVLQLSIVAIHAGRTSALEYGVVPIQVDEVNIWPPTDAQLAARKASALAWVPRRGVRSFEGSAEMAAADGELVLEVVNIRTTSYEAAVPQTDLSRALQKKKAPFGEMAWELDVDALCLGDDAAASASSGLGGPDMARLCLFKHPDLEVVQVATDDTCLESASSILQSNTNALFTLALDVVQFDEDEVAAARESIGEYPNAKLATLDILEDLESQSFAPASCDVLVAAAHLVPKLRGLVRPGGYIISNDSPAAVSRVPPTPSKKGAAESQAPYKVHLIYRGRQLPIVSDVQKALQSLGWEVAVSKLESCDKPGSTARHVVMLTDFEGPDPLLFNVTEKEFTAVQNITNSVSHLLWVTNGGLLDGKRPQHALVSGLARVVTSEQATLDFRTLDVDTDVVPAAQVVKSVVRTAQLQLDESSGGGRGAKKPEREFCVSHGGKTYISRLVRNTRLNDIYATSGHAEPTTSLRPQDHISGRVVQGKVVFEKLQEQEEAAEAGVKPGHVEVQVQCSGLTKEGVLVITGSDYPTTFSHEIGGVVKRVGDGVSSLRPGDKVVGFSVDRFASHQHVSADLLHRLEPQDDMGEAVSLLMAYGTAIYGLETLAMLQPGETVLVLHGTGAYGTAAVRVAQAKGATPYVEVRTDEEAVFLQEHLGLPSENIICAYGGGAGKVPSVASALSQLTKGHGADVVFSTGTSVETSSAREAWRCIARFGRFADAGRKDVLSRSAVDSLPLRAGALYLPFDMLDLLEARPARVAALLPGILDMYRKGEAAVPGVLSRTPLAGLNKAVAAFSDAFGAPKPVIRHEASDDSPLDLVPASGGGGSKVRFREDATYLLVGCLGGLGRSLTRWMLEKGARRFAFLSRSGVDAPSAAKLVADLEAAGAVVQVIRGDATRRDDVVRAVKSVPREYPIRGVVHAAMVLRVSDNSWEDIHNESKKYFQKLTRKLITRMVSSTKCRSQTGRPPWRPRCRAP
jgi:acyl transferase domain-containing protein/NADPH:quinone reductase-like Zn-dependent oxidoreductase